jgi:restriction system protein
MAEKSMWMVRAGGGAYAVEDFKSKGVVAIGWADNSTDWTKFANRDAIRQQIAKEHPENTDTQWLVAARQIERFLREFQIGDRVVTYDPSTRQYLLGTIKSEPRFDASVIEGLQTVRTVIWAEKQVERDDLSVSTRNSLGAISTLFRVPDAAAQEIEAKLMGRAAPIPQVSDPIEDESGLLKDVQARSIEFIKDRISRLDWDEVQELIAGLLRAMGYKPRVSPVGADRGKDIVASPDGFGFESPRIVVEVKHRKGAMGSQEIRSFLGGRHKDDKGLYVSTGGFTKDALYEAERSSIPLTLMDADDLALAITEYYDKLGRQVASPPATY